MYQAVESDVKNNKAVERDRSIMEVHRVDHESDIWAVSDTGVG